MIQRVTMRLESMQISYKSTSPGGDTIGKNKNGSGSYPFTEENYEAGLCGSGHNLTGDIPQGNATYDAARANMGSPWKMFTKTQGEELINGTNSEWTSINGMNGRKFVSNTDSSKYIFLPAGGYWDYTDLYYDNSDAWYWTTISSSSGASWFIYFYTFNSLSINNSSKYYGGSIRPIR